MSTNAGTPAGAQAALQALSLSTAAATPPLPAPSSVQPPPAAFPNHGVSLKFLRRIRDDPRMHQPMCELARPGVDVDALDLPSLRDLAKELRVLSQLDGTTEFAAYADPTKPLGFWRRALRQPPTTTTHVKICIVNPDTLTSECSYAGMLLRRGGEDAAQVGVPTHFISHAWLYIFRDLMNAIEDFAMTLSDEERDKARFWCVRCLIPPPSPEHRATMKPSERQRR